MSTIQKVAVIGAGAAEAIAALYLIAAPKASANAFGARKFGCLTLANDVTLTLSRLLSGPRAKALALIQTGVAPEPPLIFRSGLFGQPRSITPSKSERWYGPIVVYDRVVDRALTNVLAGDSSAFATHASPDLGKHMLAT